MIIFAWRVGIRGVKPQNVTKQASWKGLPATEAGGILRPPMAGALAKHKEKQDMSREVSDVIETVDATSWEGPFAGKTGPLVDALEDGKVIFFPHLNFALSETEAKFLSPACADPTAKNVSFNAATGSLKHAVGDHEALAAITAMMRRYYEHGRSLVCAAFPAYANALDPGRTSFRPVEISGRPSSERKDDTRLHVDAFPSSPVGERRILRVFSNVNRDGKSRHWRVGDRFEDVARRFANDVPAPLPGVAWLKNAIGLTRGYRTRYDHTMLAIHDAMKMDSAYQANVVQNECHFPPGSTWIVFSDLVPHAVMAGQHMFEQTFYLPLRAMATQAKSPLRVLERLTSHAMT
jgi:hypothetical protein